MLDLSCITRGESFGLMLRLNSCERMTRVSKDLRTNHGTT